MARRFYSSVAQRTALADQVNATTGTFIVNGVAGWPANTPYTLLIDADTINEEIVEVTARAGSTLTVVRGVDGSNGKPHEAGADVRHGVSARDFDEPNAFINSTGMITENLLASDSVTEAKIGTGAVTEAKIGTGAVTSTKILDGTIVNADVNASAEIAQSKIANLTADLGSKVDYALPTNAQTGTTYTFVLADGNKLTTASNASAVTLTIPPQSSVEWPASSVIRVVNYGAGAVTVEGGSGVTVTNTATTIGQYEAAAAIRTGSDAWTLVPFGASGGGAVGAADFSDAATGTYTDSGIDYKYITYTASGTLTVTTAGFADILVVGGGGGGGGTYSGGGGAGGHLLIADAYLADGVQTVTVGAGGAAERHGSSSQVGPYYGVGGGAAGANGTNKPLQGQPGGSGGGGAGSTVGDLSGGSGLNGQGNSGGTGGSGIGGGGGGGAAAGVNAAGTVAGNGGAGTATGIAGSTPTTSYTAGTFTFAGGGGGGAYTGRTAGSGGSGGGGAGTNSNAAGAAGTVNTGGGGGGGGFAGTGGAGGPGGSGVVIVRVVV